MADTEVGSVGGSLFVRAGTSVAGGLTLRTHKEFLIAGPHLANAIIGDSTAPVGVYLSISQNFNNYISTTVTSDGILQHRLNAVNDLANLYNAKNQRLVAHYDTISFSSNGNFMLFDSPGYGLVRLDTRDGTIVSFGGPTVYDNGFNPGYQLAISPSGRWAVVAASNMFYVYDLSSCQAQVGSNAHLMNCASRQLEDQRLRDAAFGRWPGYIRFINESAFSYYGTQNNGNGLVHRRYVVSIGERPVHEFGYLGLGDSFASGEGSFTYKGYTDTNTNKCHVGHASYPLLVGSAASVGSFETVACSGALLRDLENERLNIYEGQVKDGLTQTQRNLSPILNQFLPGTITQTAFVEHYDPAVVTVSVGGNDLGFADKFMHCILGPLPSGTCFDSVEDRQEIMNELYDLAPKLTDLYQNLRHSDRRVYVLGYPKLVAPGGNCAVNVSLDEREVAFANRLTILLNDVIEFAAGQAGVVYVDVEDLFVGRRLCETESSNTLVNGITQARKGGLFGIHFVAQESFHPKAEAQELYSDRVLVSTANLTSPMPKPKPLQTFPRLQPGDEFFIDLYSSGRTVYQPKYQNMLPDHSHQGESLNVSLDLFSFGFLPGTKIKAEFHSTPTPVGEFIVGPDGSLKINVKIPNTLAPGFHSLHLYGQNLAGQQIDIYDYFLVGVSAQDFDGDGIPDSSEGCVFSQLMGSDTDNDGTDDACDGVIELKTENPVLDQDVKSAEVNPIDEAHENPVEEVNLQPGFGQLQVKDDTIIGAPKTDLALVAAAVVGLPVSSMPTPVIGNVGSAVLTKIQNDNNLTEPQADASPPIILANTETVAHEAAHTKISDLTDGVLDAPNKNGRAWWIIGGFGLIFASLTTLSIIRSRRAEKFTFK